MSPSQAERSEATRAALVGAARRLFARDGFNATAAEEVVRAAGLTRGALYHHFDDKRALFRAVHEQVEQELVERIAAAVAGVEDPFELLVVGLDAFLDRCLDPDFARIALDDAPSVLGWREWREIDLRYALGLVEASLQAAIDAGAIAPQPVRPLAHLLISACGEAGLMLAAGDATRDQVRAPLLALLTGLTP